MVDSRYRLILRSVAPMWGVPDIGTSNAQVTSTRLIRDKRAAPQHEGAKDQGPKRPTAPASKQGFFLIKNREKIYGGHDELQQNGWLCSAVGSSFLE
jgi:hypothetical protein